MTSDGETLHAHACPLRRMAEGLVQGLPRQSLPAEFASEWGEAGTWVPGTLLQILSLSNCP